MTTALWILTGIAALVFGGLVIGAVRREAAVQREMKRQADISTRRKQIEAEVKRKTYASRQRYLQQQREKATLRAPVINTARPVPAPAKKSDNDDMMSLTHPLNPLNPISPVYYPYPNTSSTYPSTQSSPSPDCSPSHSSWSNSSSSSSSSDSCSSSSSDSGSSGGSSD